MHNLGKRMCLEAILPTNTTVQLNCMGWVVQLAQGLQLRGRRRARCFPAGTVLHATLWHDNTNANRANPDPRNWRGYGAADDRRDGVLVDDVDEPHRRGLQGDVGGAGQAEFELVWAVDVVAALGDPAHGAPRRFFTADGQVTKGYAH